jgi:hypothetical protein
LILEIDASNDAILAIFSQWVPYNGKCLLYPIAYRSRKLSEAEKNYGIGDKEMLVIVDALSEYCLYIESLSSPLLVFTDYLNLSAFALKKVLNR